MLICTLQMIGVVGGSRLRSQRVCVSTLAHVARVHRRPLCTSGLIGFELFDIELFALSTVLVSL